MAVGTSARSNTEVVMGVVRAACRGGTAVAGGGVVSRFEQRTKWSWSLLPRLLQHLCTEFEVISDSNSADGCAVRDLVHQVGVERWDALQAAPRASISAEEEISFCRRFFQPLEKRG